MRVCLCLHACACACYRLCFVHYAPKKHAGGAIELLKDRGTAPIVDAMFVDATFCDASPQRGYAYLGVVSDPYRCPVVLFAARHAWGECHETWGWVFDELVKACPSVVNIVCISDQHISIKYAAEVSLLTPSYMKD